MRFIDRLIHLACLVCLCKRLGHCSFAALVDPSNTYRFMKFCKELNINPVPNIVHIGERTYQILPFLGITEASADGRATMAESHRQDASSQDHVPYILENANSIDAVLNDYVFVFALEDRVEEKRLKWGFERKIVCIFYDEKEKGWRQDSRSVNSEFGHQCRLLRQMSR